MIFTENNIGSSSTICTFFNSVSEDLYEVCTKIINKESFSYNGYVGCFFPNELDFDETPYEGVKFISFVHGEEEIISEIKFVDIISNVVTVGLKNSLLTLKEKTALLQQLEIIF